MTDRHTRSVRDAANLSQFITPLVEQAPDGILYTALDHTILYANHAFSRLLKHATSDEVWDLSLETLIIDPPDTLTNIVAHITGHTTWFGLLTFRLPCGDTIPRQIQAFGVHNQAGHLSGIGYTVYASVSQPTHTNNQQFRTAIDNMLDGFALLSTVRDDQKAIRDFRYEYINPAGQQISALPADMMQGSSLHTLHPDLVQQGIFDRYVDVVETGVPFVGESFCCDSIDPAGQSVRRYFDFRVFACNDGLAIVWRDVTERVQSEQALHEVQERYRVLIESDGFPIAMYDHNGTVLLLNSFAARHLGGRPEDFVGKTLAEIFPDDHVRSYLKRIHDVIATDQPECREEESTGPHGTRWFWTCIYPVHSANGQPFAVQVIAHDITERKHTEQALRASEERFRVVSELISDWAYCHTLLPDGRSEFGWLTPSFYSTTGYIPGDFATPRDWLRVIYPDDLPIMHRRMQKLSGGQTDVSEYRYFARNGSLRWVRDYGWPEWSAAEQRVVQVIGTVLDITEQRQSELVLKRRVRQFDALRETMNRITSELDLNLLLNTILEHAIDLIDLSSATSGQIALYDAEQNDLLILACINLDVTLIGTRQPLTERGTGQVIQTHRPLVISDYQIWQERLPQYAGMGAHALVLVPLLAGEQVLGILIIGHTSPYRAFDEADIELLTLFAQQATIAIQNARLFAEVQRLATTDPLTGLHNRRSFFDLARRTYENATRYDHPLSAIMLDIDHFKQVNDTFGHTVGDQVLHAVASRCLGILRVVDIIGRYGGEEIIMLLPETDGYRARQVAERLRWQFYNTPIPTDRGVVSITISLGVATVVKMVTLSLDQLIDRADQALYVAKQSGRNQVVVWE